MNEDDTEIGNGIRLSRGREPWVALLHTKSARAVSLSRERYTQCEHVSMAASRSAWHGECACKASPRTTALRTASTNSGICKPSFVIRTLLGKKVALRMQTRCCECSFPRELILETSRKDSLMLPVLPSTTSQERFLGIGVRGRLPKRQNYSKDECPNSGVNLGLTC